MQECNQSRVDEPAVLLKELEAALGQSKRIGESIRFETCPFCEARHPNNLALALDRELKVFMCHDCGKGGSVVTLLKKIEVGISVDETASGQLPPAADGQQGETYQGLVESLPEGVVDRYLKGRGINPSTWSALDLKLKDLYVGNNVAGFVYPFVNQQGEIVAFQRTFIDPTTFKRTDRRYQGPKSQGVALLKSAPEIIVAEGLETGLSVLQHLGPRYGLVICGDAGNLASLAGTNRWCIERFQKVILAADNDLENTGIEAAREVYESFKKKCVIYMPALPGTDWNDVLRQGRIEKEWI